MGGQTVGGQRRASYRYWGEAAQEAWDDATDPKYGLTREQWATNELADRLKAEHEEALPELTGFASDLLTAAFGEVNWHEIARSLLEEVDKEEEGEGADEPESSSDGRE